MSNKKVEQMDEILCSLQQTKDQWDEEDGVEDEQDQLLSQAIDLALKQGRGWGPGEKEAYLEKILDDDFIPPLFAQSQQEVEKSGLQEAFTSLIYDGESPTSLMKQFKKKGKDSFAAGKLNQVGNVQYFRDAVNHYYEALAWAKKIEPLQEGDLAQADTDEETYNETELDELRSSLCSNIALSHLQLKNWGLVRDEAKHAISFNKGNVKAWYFLAKAHQNLSNWEEAGNAIESGLAIEGQAENTDLKKLEKLLTERIQRARKLRQQRERKRAERVARVKEVWKHSKDIGLQLARVHLVSTVSDEDIEGDDNHESRWNFHLPHSGELPAKTGSEWHWPCMFLYPSHNQSDFVPSFGETELLAIRLAEMFPELEDEQDETSLPWDHMNDFVCSKLSIYFMVHKDSQEDEVGHPDSVEILKDQASAMRFYEASRALKGDEGPDIANVVEALERKHLYKRRKAWKKKHGSLWAMPKSNPIVRIHPAVTLGEILRDPRMIVPNVSSPRFLFSGMAPISNDFYPVLSDSLRFPRESSCAYSFPQRTSLRRYSTASAATAVNDSL